MKWKLTCSVLVLTAACVASSAFGSTIATGTSFNITLTDANHQPSDSCAGAFTPGWTDLFALSPLAPNNTYSQDFLDALDTQFSTNTENAGYTIEYDYSIASASLTGDLLIDWYKARDYEDGAWCYHGAEIVAYYDYGEGEEALNLDWVQIYDEGGDIANPSPYDYTVDGFDDQSPAYYNPGNLPWEPTGYTLETGHDMAWSDAPFDSHLEANAWSGSVDFYMFLCGFGNPYPDPFDPLTLHQDVTIYDGVGWGYYGLCYIVPEPSTFVLTGIGLALLAAHRKQRRNK